MDFGTILHVAKKNNENQKESRRYYNTKFAPPKKEAKESKLSENIKKFLERQHEEERKKKEEERRKLTNLLAMRDEKSKNKIKKMLKVTKSANKSVLDDVIKDHTAVTLQGPEQPDQDDYGYVSNEANAFYQKYIEKVKDVKDDRGFAPSRPQSVKDLAGTKERVKAAISREAEEKRNHSRQSSTQVSSQVKASTTVTNPSGIERHRSSSKPLYDPEAEKREADKKKREEMQEKVKNRKPLPPPMDFQALLKLAEKKQHEPIEFAPVVKKKEPERLLTMKEKRELEERQRSKCKKDRDGKDMQIEVKEKIEKKNTTGFKDKDLSKKVTENKERLETKGCKIVEPSGRVSKPGMGSGSLISNEEKSNSITKKPESILRNSLTIPHLSSPINKEKKLSKMTQDNMSPASSKDLKLIASQKSKIPVLPSKCSKNTNIRQFPPSDIRRSNQMNSNTMSRQKKPPKRRILDDDEYDSEMDDFIDDGDCEEDYSAHIREIFGYDKNKYKYADDDEDDAAMESNFAQVQREEYISKKIGLQEDLEDMKMEALEKKRKLMKKKKLA